MEIRLGELQITEESVGHVGVIVLACVDKRIVNGDK
jgi:hypothetical protein